MREKKETLEKNNDNLKLKKIAKKQKMQERGITLIALVVTIIILLILAGVTLNIALSDNGLFSKTKKAAEEYKQAQSEEEDLISQVATQMYSEYVGAEVIGYQPTEKTITIEGATTGLSSNIDDNENEITGEEDGSQKFSTDKEMKWRVWDYDGNTLRIIGDTTTQQLTLKGAAGYNNGIWALDQICKELYSNDKPGVSVTNLKRTDIQKVSTYDYTKYKHEPNDFKEYMANDNDNLIYFGAIKTYTEYNKYPAMWNKNDKDWTYKYDNGTITVRDKECKKWEEIVTEDGQMGDKMIGGSEETIFKQSYYYHKYNKDEFINDKYYDLIFKKSNGTSAANYWIAGRCIRLDEEYCEFDLQTITAFDNQSQCGRS